MKTVQHKPKNIYFNNNYVELIEMNKSSIEKCIDNLSDYKIVQTIKQIAYYL
ncbi:hypothetical protein [Brachyspira sp. G79]|uniref:hypothetical protein n=1 Tax=Brachyspira sp. G79 TaxID=1358104 RepID=UPI00143B76D8|nr:hypothetical protein [Brachyspira sp. G79]